MTSICFLIKNYSNNNDTKKFKKINNKDLNYEKLESLKNSDDTIFILPPGENSQSEFYSPHKCYYSNIKYLIIFKESDLKIYNSELSNEINNSIKITELSKNLYDIDFKSILMISNNNSIKIYEIEDL